MVAPLSKLPAAQPQVDLPASTDLLTLNRLLRTIHICECVIAADETEHADALHVVEQIVMHFFSFSQTSTHGAANNHLVEPLTPREREVLSLVAHHLTNDQISDQLCITGTTVKKHLSNIYSKLGAQGRGEAVLRAELYGFALSNGETPREAIQRGGES